MSKSFCRNDLSSVQRKSFNSWYLVRLQGRHAFITEMIWAQYSVSRSLLGIWYVFRDVMRSLQYNSVQNHNKHSCSYAHVWRVGFFIFCPFSPDKVVKELCCSFHHLSTLLWYQWFVHRCPIFCDISPYFKVICFWQLNIGTRPQYSAVDWSGSFTLHITSQNWWFCQCEGQLIEWLSVC